MRSSQANKGASHESGEQSRAHRKGQKRKQFQQNISMPLGSAGQTYGSGLANANASHVMGTTAQAHTSSRSQSNKAVNGRKSNSIKYKSSSKQQVGTIIEVGATLAKRQQVHSRQTADSMLERDPNTQVQMEDQVYQTGNTTSAKAVNKHRKLSRQASSGPPQDSFISPQNNGRKNENQIFKLKSPAKQGIKISPRDIASTVADQQHMQYVIEKHSFSSQPDFMVAGHSQALQTQASQQTKPARNYKQTGSDSPQLLNKKKQTYIIENELYQVGVDGAYSELSGELTSLSQELTRPQVLHQQLYQQQLMRQQLQNVQLEVKGSMAVSSQMQTNGGYGPTTAQVGANSQNYSGLKQVYAQQKVSANLTQGVALLDGVTPQQRDKSHNIFLHHPSSLTQHRQQSSLSRTEHIGPSTKIVVAQQIPQIEVGMNSQGIQNSKSPFKVKPSQKMLRGMPIPEFVESAGMEVLPVPSTTIKKQTSTKNQLRKQSAKKADNPAAYISGGIPVHSMDDQKLVGLQGLSHKSGPQAISMAHSMVNGVEVTSALSSQKGLKNQASHKKIPSSPDKQHRKSKPKFYVEGTDLGASDLNPSNVGNNVSGLLNMSKQRACKLDAEPNLSQFSVVASEDQTLSYFSASKEASQAKTNTTVMPKELKLGPRQDRSGKKVPKSKHEKQRSDSQQNQRNMRSSQIGGYAPNKSSNTFGKKNSYLPTSSGQEGSFQQSGKQIIQGQQQLMHHKQNQIIAANQLADSANSTGSQNKTLPISIFEMQFYQGDFIFQQPQHNGALGAKPAFMPNGGKPGIPATLSIPQHFRIAANGALQTPSQVLPKNVNQKTQSMSNINKHTGVMQDPALASFDRQKVNFMALQSFHQQWIASHGNHYNASPQVPQRNSAGSQQTISLQGNAKGSHSSPNKPQVVKHHGLLNSTINPISQQAAMQTLLQQNKTHGPSAMLHHQMANAAQSQVNLYGIPVQVNGRQMQVPNNQVGMNGLPINFSQLGISVGSSMASVVQAQSTQTRFLPSELQQAYMHTVSDPFELMHMQQQQEVLSQQLMAIQHAAQSQQMPSNYERKRKDTNVFKRAASKIPFENAYVEDCFKFIIGYGNNSGLIRNALKQRSWWIEIQPVHSMFNFKWAPVSDGIKFARLGHVEPFKREQGTMGMKPREGGKEKDVHPPALDKVNFQMVNHLENHQLLTEKYNLLMVMQRFCDLHKENTFDIMPITFFVEIPDASRDQLITQALTPFTMVWQTLEANKNKLNMLKDQLIRQLHSKIELEDKEASDIANGAKPNQALLDKIQRLESVTGSQLSQPSNSGKITKFKAFNFEKRTYQKFTMPLCHFDSFNLWLLKPTHLNRGRGIHVFHDLETLNKLIKQYCIGKEEVSSKKKDTQPKDTGEKQDVSACAAEGENPDQTGQNQVDSEFEDLGPGASPTKTASPQKKTSTNKIKHNTFIIQKYIERPLLIYKRKFDIRVWVLLNQDQDLFFFKEGYLRTSSSEFGIDLTNIDNAFVHLTNNAVQKNAENYGDFEDGNQLSFKRFQEYIDEFHPESGISVHDNLVPQMHEIIVKTFNAVRRSIDPNHRKFCFELFGYDFILDEDFNCWLIEVNTNPCIEESSQLLKGLLPRMIEDMMRLTIDIVFPKNSIRRRKDQKKNKLSSPTKTQNAFTGLSLHQKRETTAKKVKLQQQSSEDSNMKRVGVNDAELSPQAKDNAGRARSKTNSTDENSVQPQLQASDVGDFTSQAALSQSLPDSDINRDESAPEKDISPPLMTIKEKLSRSRVHPVPGYSDGENMWFKLMNLDKDPVANVTKYPNKKSTYIIQVQDKVFKMRKNPAYTGPLNLPFLQPDPDELLAEKAIAEEEDFGDVESPEDAVTGGDCYCP